MDLSTQYLGLRLSGPLMPGASPLVDNLDNVKRLEDAGASAIVMHSLFEEQVEGNRHSSIYHAHMFSDSGEEIGSFFPRTYEYHLTASEYLDQIRRIKEATEIPVIASLNGTTPSGWLKYAREIQQAGADALELNVYHVSADPQETGAEVENRILEAAQEVKRVVTLPLAVKLSPFLSSLPNLCAELDRAGVQGLILFNRFYQPDIDLKTMAITHKVMLSDSSELLLRLRALAVTAGHLKASLAASGGVHTAEDAIKCILAGANVIQVVSALMIKGIEHLKTIRQGMEEWMEQNGYASLRQMRGCMSLSLCADPTAFERGNYMRVLNSWRGVAGHPLAPMAGPGDGAD